MCVTFIIDISMCTTEMKNALEGFNNRMHETEEQISELKDKAMENAQIAQQVK